MKIPESIDEFHMSKRLHPELEHSLTRDNIADTLGDTSDRVAVRHLGHRPRIEVLRDAAVLAADEKSERKFMSFETCFVVCEKCLIYYANNSRQANESEP